MNARRRRDEATRPVTSSAGSPARKNRKFGRWGYRIPTEESSEPDAAAVAQTAQSPIAKNSRCGESSDGFGMPQRVVVDRETGQFRLSGAHSGPFATPSEAAFPCVPEPFIRLDGPNFHEVRMSISPESYVSRDPGLASLNGSLDWMSGPADSIFVHLLSKRGA
jgi:hypothetical protein